MRGQRLKIENWKAEIEPNMRPSGRAHLVGVANWGRLYAKCDIISWP